MGPIRSVTMEVDGMFYGERLRGLEEALAGLEARLARMEIRLEGLGRAVEAQSEAERRFQEGLSSLMSYQGPGEE